MTGLRLQGEEDYEEFARALKAAGDKVLSRRVNKAMRDVAKPIGDRILRDGAAKLPHRGGLSSRVASTPPALRFRTSANSVYAALVFGGNKRKGIDFRSIDSGVLRHPVFAGRRFVSTGAFGTGAAKAKWTWVRQEVTPGAFSDELPKHLPTLRGVLVDAIQETLNDVAKEV